MVHVSFSRLVLIILTASICEWDPSSIRAYSNVPVSAVHLVPTASEGVDELAALALNPRGHLFTHVDVVGLDAVEEQLVRRGIHLG